MNSIHEDKAWYFWDETGAYRYGPFVSKEVAELKLEQYCKLLDQTVPEGRKPRNET